MANDRIKGNSTGEEILGGDGDDIIAGGGGNDILRGQYDDDLLLGESGDDYLNGGVGNDELYGGSGFDELHGSYGNDILYYSEGAEIFEGGDDYDTFWALTRPSLVTVNGSITGTVVYDPVGYGVRIDIENGVIEDRGTGAATEDYYAPGVLGIGRGDAELNSIEAYELTSQGDYFAGDNTGDEINGNGGNDIIEGRGGADDINGGSGSDTVEYGSSGYGTGSGVNVDLERGTGFIGDAEGDTFTSIENIRGSAYMDALYGNDLANTIMGRAGNDFIEGRGGADVLDGGDGEDTVFYLSSPAGVNVDLRRTTGHS